MNSLFDSGIRPVIDEHLLKLSKETRDYGDYWSASSAGYCMRKTIFTRLGLPPVSEDPRKQRVFTSGHIFHEWIQKLTKDAGISIAQEIELQDEDLMIRGHIDDLVLMKATSHNLGEAMTELHTKGSTQYADYLILYDYKTRNSKNFHYAKQPSYLHKMQLGTYMYMLRKLKEVPVTDDMTPVIKAKNLMTGKTDYQFTPQDLTEARTLNIEKDTLRMAEVQYMWTPELEKEVLDYWTELNKFWVEKKLPPCTCHVHAGGFMALEKWNPYFYEGKPCSIEWLTKHPDVKEKWA